MLRKDKGIPESLVSSIQYFFGTFGPIMMDLHGFTINLWTEFTVVSHIRQDLTWLKKTFHCQLIPPIISTPSTFEQKQAKCS